MAPRRGIPALSVTLPEREERVAACISRESSSSIKSVIKRIVEALRR
jgi:hypothetical protein